MITQALWHLEVPAGEEVPMLVRKDFQLTNAALTEEIGDINDRTVVKVMFQPTVPRDDDDEDDDEFDSDDEDDIDLDQLDEEDLASDADDDEELKALKRGLRAKKATGEAIEDEIVNGDVDEEEDDDEDDEDEDDEDDITIDEEPVDVAVCALTPGKIEQVQLNLVFNEDDVVVFKNLGKNTVHLLGNYINQDPHYGHDHDDEDSEFDYDSEGNPIYDDEDDEDDFEDEDDSDLDMEDLERVVGRKGGKTDAARFSEVVEEPAATKPAAVAAAKKRKAEEQEAVEKPSKKAEKKQKTEKAAAAAAPVAESKKAAKAADKPEQQGSKKRTLPSGLVIEDVKIGDGPVAKSGKRCGMRYIGKLLNGKQFDANTSGAPFTFRLGAGEVIKGWDVGVAGMAVGGERKLTIPASLAYGSQKIPGIPANSTLNFDIKLVNVK